MRTFNIRFRFKLLNLKTLGFKDRGVEGGGRVLAGGGGGGG